MNPVLDGPIFSIFLFPMSRGRTWAQLLFISFFSYWSEADYNVCAGWQSNWTLNDSVSAPAQCLEKDSAHFNQSAFRFEGLALNGCVCQICIPLLFASLDYDFNADWYYTLVTNRPVFFRLASGEVFRYSSTHFNSTSFISQWNYPFSLSLPH